MSLLYTYFLFSSETTNILESKVSSISQQSQISMLNITLNSEIVKPITALKLANSIQWPIEMSFLSEYTIYDLEIPKLVLFYKKNTTQTAYILKLLENKNLQKAPLVDINEDPAQWAQFEVEFTTHKGEADNLLAVSNSKVIQEWNMNNKQFQIKTMDHVCKVKDKDIYFVVYKEASGLSVWDIICENIIQNFDYCKYIFKKFARYLSSFHSETKLIHADLTLPNIIWNTDNWGNYTFTLIDTHSVSILLKEKVKDRALQELFGYDRDRWYFALLYSKNTFHDFILKKGSRYGKLQAPEEDLKRIALARVGLLFNNCYRQIYAQKNIAPDRVCFPYNPKVDLPDKNTLENSTIKDDKTLNQDNIVNILFGPPRAETKTGLAPSPH